MSGRGSLNAFQVLTAQAGLYFIQAGPACLPASHSISTLENDTTTLLSRRRSQLGDNALLCQTPFSMIQSCLGHEGCYHVCPSPTSVLLRGPTLHCLPPVVLGRVLCCDSALYLLLPPNTTSGTLPTPTRIPIH